MNVTVLSLNSNESDVDLDNKQWHKLIEEKIKPIYSITVQNKDVLRLLRGWELEPIPSSGITPQIKSTFIWTNHFVGYRPDMSNKLATNSILIF